MTNDEIKTVASAKYFLRRYGKVQMRKLSPPRAMKTEASFWFLKNNLTEGQFNRFLRNHGMKR